MKVFLEENSIGSISKVLNKSFESHVLPSNSIVSWSLVIGKI